MWSPPTLGSAATRAAPLCISPLSAAGTDYFYWFQYKYLVQKWLYCCWCSVAELNKKRKLKTRPDRPVRAEDHSRTSRRSRRPEDNKLQKPKADQDLVGASTQIGAEQLVVTLLRCPTSWWRLIVVCGLSLVILIIWLVPTWC